MIDKFIQWFFEVGQKRAESQLRKMGYDLKTLRVNENLKDRV